METLLLTVEEFQKLPDPSGGRYELHHGEAVFVEFRNMSRKRFQRKLRKSLESTAPGFWIDTEVAYMPLPENELWGSDVACISITREQQITTWLEGSPELVIEVRVPDVTQLELHDKAMTTLAGHGSNEFWVVDPKEQLVTVYSKLSGMHMYGSNDSVPVPICSGNINLTQLFEAIV